MATLKHTVKPSGGDFTSLDAAVDHLVASHANLVTADVYAEIEISGSWSSPDTAAVTITGLTTDATHYLSIYTDTANRASMPWNTNKYNLYIEDDTCIYQGIEYLRIDGLQLGNHTITGHTRVAVRLWSSSWYANLRYSNCVFKAAGSGDYINSGLIGERGANIYAWNSVFYNFGSLWSDFNAGIYIDSDISWCPSSASAYNCVSIGAHRGFYKVGSYTTFVAKNCYVSARNTGYGGITLTTCASSDTTGTAGLQNIAADADTFKNVTGGSEDYHLAVDGLSPLQNVGTDTSADAAPLNFTTDMDGVTFVDDWDIGAFANVASAPTYIPKVIII
jgi:hypothetical protein